MPNRHLGLWIVSLLHALATELKCSSLLVYKGNMNKLVRTVPAQCRDANVDKDRMHTVHHVKLSLKLSNLNKN
jgi:hypothetical protein